MVQIMLFSIFSIGLTCLMVYVAWNVLTLQGVTGGELVKSTPSPNGDYTIHTFFRDGGVETAHSVRCELVNVKTNESKNIYFNFPDYNPFVEWLDQDLVKIGNKTLNISEGETYDWRRDHGWRKEVPRQWTNEVKI